MREMFRQNFVLKLLFFAFAFISNLRAFAQTDSLSCAGLKTGNFYYFSSASGETHRISMIRDSALQKEIDGKDTTYFKASWINDCLLKLVFIRSTRTMSREEGDFYRLHSGFTNIVAVKPEYYLFKGSLDSVRVAQTSIDTMWRRR